MSFSSRVEDTPQTLWKELEQSGARLLMTIPFNSPIEIALGFMSVAGDQENLPLLTICVINANTERTTVSTIVFPNSKEFEKLVNKLYIDFATNFNSEDIEWQKKVFMKELNTY